MVALLLVGLPDTALREARDRIRSAIVNSRETWPTRRITVGLSPASLPKRGSGFDLGIAVAIPAASGTLPAGSLEDLVLIGELGLDGRIRPVPGVLPAAAAAAAAGFGAVAVATENAAEAALVPQLRVIAAPSLAHSPPGSATGSLPLTPSSGCSSRAATSVPLSTWSATRAKGTRSPGRSQRPSSPRSRTWPTLSDSQWPGAPPRSAPPAAIT